MGALTLAWLPIVMTVVGILLVETTLFVYGTPVGLPVTDAQGRYLYPFVALPLLTIDCFRRERQVPRSTRWIIAGSCRHARVVGHQDLRPRLQPLEEVSGERAH